MRRRDMCKIPDKFPLENTRDINQYMDGLMMREEWISKGMFAFVSWEWVRPLAGWIGERKVLEVMSGAGWLARALTGMGVSVCATDNNSWLKEHEKKWEHQVDIEELGAIEAIEKYGRQVDLLIISWPYMDEDAYNVLVKMHEVNPAALIIYIGEIGGCCASESFFEHYEYIEDEQFEQVSRKFRSWPCIHDILTLGKYKDNKVE